MQEILITKGDTSKIKEGEHNFPNLKIVCEFTNISSSLSLLFLILPVPPPCFNTFHCLNPLMHLSNYLQLLKFVFFSSCALFMKSSCLFY